MKFTIINKEDVPENLPPGTYKCRIVSATWDEIRVEFVNEEISDDPYASLLKFIKRAEDSIKEIKNED